MDDDRIANFVGGEHKFPHAKWLQHIARDARPVAVMLGENIKVELEYGNFTRADEFGQVLEKVTADVACGRASIFPGSRASDSRGLCTSALGLVEEKARRRIFHELTFGVPGVSETEQPVKTISGWGKTTACAPVFRRDEAETTEIASASLPSVGELYLRQDDR